MQSIILHNIHPFTEVVFARHLTDSAIVEMSGYIEGYMRICEIGHESAPDLDTAVGFASVYWLAFDNGPLNLREGSKDGFTLRKGSDTYL